MQPSVWHICFTNVNDELMLGLRVAVVTKNLLTSDIAFATWVKHQNCESWNFYLAHTIYSKLKY